jgi:hypothetical protein
MSSSQPSERPDSPNSPSWFIYTPGAKKRTSDMRRPSTPSSHVTTKTELSVEDSPEPDTSPPVFSSIAWQGPASRRPQDLDVFSPRITAPDPDMTAPLEPPRTKITISTPPVSHLRHAEPLGPRIQGPEIRALTPRPLPPWRQQQDNPSLVHPFPRRYSRPSWISAATSPEYQVQSTPPSSSTSRFKQARDISQATAQHPIPAHATNHLPSPPANPPTFHPDPAATPRRQRPAPLLLHDPIPRTHNLPQPALVLVLVLVQGPAPGSVTDRAQG